VIEAAPDTPAWNPEILGEAPRAADGHAQWYARCHCGSVKPYTKYRLKVAKSCGCVRPKTNLQHGMRKTKEYCSWGAIKKRCLNPNDKDYPRYGGAGVTMYPQWAESFEAFFAEVGKAPSRNHSIDRIDTRLGYQPGNVRWATHSEQQRNKTTSWYWKVGDHVFDSISDAAAHYGVAIQTIHKWCAGYKDLRRGERPIPQRDGCERIAKYEHAN